MESTFWFVTFKSVGTYTGLPIKLAGLMTGLVGLAVYLAGMCGRGGFGGGGLGRAP